MVSLWKMYRWVLLALSLVGGIGVSGPAQAVVSVPVPVLSTFEWVGDCSDCTAIGNPASTQVSATLVLQDYTPGDAISLGHLVSFSYSGSNLVNPYTVTPDSFVYYIAGSITSTQGPGHFELVWLDGLHFETQVTNGAWSTCAPGINPANGQPIFYGGSNCDFARTVNTDFGTGGTFTTAAVPEPGVWAMLCAGLGLLALARRRRERVA